ncbi:sodium-dependent dopamine transporter [Lepeophtheirus salmonis]|uniref:Transporter n=1 Tax=Lepeophtheirus salmonis TaxID=72036 RepID=A0A0K2USJ4_LEPSM|nr:sodium-dependent dopamine transporter-like [Lepeophtheirus salmonis]
MKTRDERLSIKMSTITTKDQPSKRTGSLGSLPEYSEIAPSPLISACLETGSCKITVVSPSQDKSIQGDVLKCKQTTIIKMKKNNRDTEVEFTGNLVEKHESSQASSRITWDNNMDFLLSIIGFAVDLANVWRFPYLCYRNGGGAFLIPYVLMLVFGAMPLFYMEIVLGQFHSQGPISLWKICPIFKGVGYCAVLVAFYVSFYYNVIIGWSFYYLLQTFTRTLPWTNCNNTWNTNLCAKSCIEEQTNITCEYLRSPSKEYFNREVLKIQESDGFENLGLPIWQLTLCLMVIYILLYLSLFKGVKSSGKVVWITATMPYILLSILLIRGLLLPGALSGIHFYLIPNLKALQKASVWTEAAIQIFYSVGAGFGVHLAYASYNKFDNNCYRDCLITSAVNSFTSFFSGFVIFTYLGYMAKSQNKDISKVAAQGPGLVFEVYPEAVATLPGSHIWSFLFFIMLIMLGMDSAMGGLECVITGIMDEFKETFRKYNISRELFTAFIVFSSFLVALSCATPGGLYVFNLLENYAAGLSLLITVFFEAVAVSWFYGLEQFSSDIKKMLGFEPNLYWKVCWKIISPSFLFVIIVLQISSFGPLSFEMYDKSVYTYPFSARVIGWLLGLSSVIMIPTMAIVALCKKPGNLKQKIALSISPDWEESEIRHESNIKRFTKRHWLYLKS